MPIKRWFYLLFLLPNPQIIANKNINHITASTNNNIKIAGKDKIKTINPRTIPNIFLPTNKSLTKSNNADKTMLFLFLYFKFVSDSIPI